MLPLRIDAPAKLNLFLHITGKRPDNFHLLESLIIFTQFGDRLEFAPSDHLQLSVTGPFADAIDTEEDNLVLRAARALGGGRGAHITLHKHIPVAAGLGGGSADAAATLRGLITLWGLEIGDSELQRIAVRLGSDVPVCLRSQAAFVSGIGEFVSPVGVTGPLWLALVNPGEKLPTAEVFRHFYTTPAASLEPPRLIDSLPELMDYTRPKYNMLEAAAKKLLPVIGNALEAIAATPGCLLSRMSGSGATCFGVYESQNEAETAVRLLMREYPKWWCVATGMYGQT
jgi:4-diphosphocytidyl-2-C-methyl-D-erythritol kinase